ncbi:peptide-methionine (S)-S-oxide reductase MsrA [Ideonella livida]|uniref:Peptide methionine sulfoxide reductase MsrA n=1 Tax=Ideonella livida TaxID=2707176 RepID=A0A7C9TJF2_9BURK|nr:peptide-methionine (S)-S-oxide reductase MsrA [Ideonella livida]NDY91718.1 peptide-methionine (S)-S-oxide reductase MsrA [Ideonella livida]
MDTHHASPSSPPADSPRAVETITLAGGCFWCLEAVFEQCVGVISCTSGYANGHISHPTYEQVCSGQTGHAEVVRLQFDPRRVSLRELLEVFFLIHDPTTLNRQGHDVGTQYRSGIYWHHESQRQVIESVVAELSVNLSAAGGGTPVTEQAPLRSWWPAEPEHQHYFARHPHQGYCAWVVAPKVHKFQAAMARLVRPGP